MKGIVQTGFGAPTDVLELQRLDRPPLGDDDAVLIRVHATSIHIGDVYGIRGLPKSMRPIFRAMRGPSGVVGSDVAGTVEAVGTNVTSLQPGDAVFGTAKGGFAEFASAEQNVVALKPDDLTFVEASAIGVSAFTALQALRNAGVRAGQSVLVVGASGGVGTFAVQLAASMGATVTGVCSTRNLDMVRSLGADDVIDYTQEDFTRSGPRYDVILDNIGSHSLTDTRRALRPDGTLIPNGAAAPSGWFGGLGRPVRAAIVSLFVKQQGRGFVSSANEDDVASLRELAATRAISPVIDRTYPLDEGIDAIAHVGEGHARGTTVITMEES